MECGGADAALDGTASSRLVHGRSKAVSPSLQDFATRTPYGLALSRRLPPDKNRLSLNTYLFQSPTGGRIESTTLLTDRSVTIFYDLLYAMFKHFS